MTARGWAVAGLAVALGGCATGDCTGSRLYDDASVADGLRAPAGLSIPEPDPAFRIPSVDVPEPDRHIRTREDGSCLSSPPPFERPEDPEGEGAAGV